MAGGSGTRFWPESRRTRPKQFLRLAGPRTMLQMTYDRIVPWIAPERVWVVTNQVQAEETRRQLPAVPAGNVLVEPCGRNTAPCIGLAAIHVLQGDPEATMLVMPADHVIRPPQQFRTCIEGAVRLLDEDRERLVLIGVPPTYPATGFGYIEREGETGDGSRVAGVDAPDSRPGKDDSRPLFHRVASFREKPDRDTAEGYRQSGRFYWNCGIFVWRAARILAALQACEPEMHARLSRLAARIGGPGWDAALSDEFPRMNSISIDYAVLERDENICVVPAPFEWDDVGSWHAIARLQAADADGNTIGGPHCGLDTRNCIVRTTEDHLVATLGLEDCIVVHTPDATLVARADDENAVKKLVELLKERGYERFL
jgi:mannose-1-phosphate guanylyltransferase